MVNMRHFSCITSVSFIHILYSAVVLAAKEMDFETALEIVRAHGVVMDVRQHQAPGTHHVVDNSISKSEMADLETKHSQAIRIALEGIDELSRNLTGKEIFRRPDGLGNNIKHPRWGAAFHIQNRLLQNSYSDGTGMPRIKAKSGNHLPSARTVSLRCFLPSREEKPFFDRDTSQLFVFFGQFVDHDIISTSLEMAFGCCSGDHMNDTLPESPCFPIQLEPGDRFFKGNCMNFRRAFGVINKGVREQVNTATSFVDASTIYGSNEAEQNHLRMFECGLLNMTDKEMLPLRHYFPCVKKNIPECPLAGDSRVSEIPSLSALHMTFHREHNRLAKKLRDINPHWDDERLFQEARKINTAQHQNIVFYEFLPKLLGPDVISIFGIDEPYVYNPKIDPSVLNVFGACAFRFGHTLLSGLQYFHRNDSHFLSELFFQPESVLYKDEGLLRDVILNLARRFAHKFDSFFTTEVTDKLYLGVDSETEPGESFDLQARNIQRGRDHGLQPYTEYLEYCLKKLHGIDGIAELNLPTCLKNGVYESVADIDVFCGGIYETPLTGAVVGPTFACIIAEQFYRLKFGDRFFFETPDTAIGFKPDQLAEIKETASLSALICRNSKVKYIQPRALDSRRSKENHKQPCSTYRDLNLELWREYPGDSH